VVVWDSFDHEFSNRSSELAVVLLASDRLMVDTMMLGRVPVRVWRLALDPSIIV
jgi:hypothetical protein